MKFAVVFCVVLLAFTIVLAKKQRHNNEDQGKSLKKATKECQRNNDTRVDAVVLKKLKKHKQVVLPDNLGDHKLCVFKGAGYINDDNTVSEELLKKKITKKATDEQDVDVIVAECKVVKATPKETALNMDACLNKHDIEL